MPCFLFMFNCWMLIQWKNTPKFRLVCYVFIVVILKLAFWFMCTAINHVFVWSWIAAHHFSFQHTHTHYCEINRSYKNIIITNKFTISHRIIDFNQLIKIVELEINKCVRANTEEKNIKIMISMWRLHSSLS